MEESLRRQALLCAVMESRNLGNSDRRPMLSLGCSLSKKWFGTAGRRGLLSPAGATDDAKDCNSHNICQTRWASSKMLTTRALTSNLIPFFLPSADLQSCVSLLSVPASFLQSSRNSVTSQCSQPPRFLDSALFPLLVHFLRARFTGAASFEPGCAGEESTVYTH